MRNFFCNNLFHRKNLPHIWFELTAEGQKESFYKSHFYIIDKKDEYTAQSWKVPPMFLPGMKMNIKVEIPEGTVLKVRNFFADYSYHSAQWNGGLKHNAHLGFYGIAPENTMPAFEFAAICGFPACIVVPKVTADGVIVCIHDDTINRTARDKNGNPPEKDMYVHDYTYDELLEWDYGAYKNEIYKNTKIPLLDDFFRLCYKTGMYPMFSTHPGLTIEQWKKVKNMLINYGLLKIFHIKSFSTDILETAYSVFGPEIDGYTFDSEEFDDSKLELLLNSGIETSKYRVGVEIKFDNYTMEIAKKIKNAGLFAAVWGIDRKDMSEYERLISYGVTEFTEDFHCSMGLNW